LVAEIIEHDIIKSHNAANKKTAPGSKNWFGLRAGRQQFFVCCAGKSLQVQQLVDTDGPFFMRWEASFEPVKENLPFTRGVIGYAADWDIPGVE